jgi:hypothetical protein
MLIFSLSSILQIANPAYALLHSSKVAYVTDFGSGIGDAVFRGSSILRNAITGIVIPSGGSYTTASGTQVTFTDVPVSKINTDGLNAISGFDTVMLYQVCDIGAPVNAPLVTALNSYLNAGLGKVVIFDGDRCAPSYGGIPDYSTFLFPFTSSNPGPLGATGTLSLIENETSLATLAKGVKAGFVGDTDAIGDSNTFTSNAGGWCSAFQGTNILKATGIQEGYVRTSAGGLAIWNGNDMWFTFGPNAHDKVVFDNILDQPSNPDGLPCGLPVTGIKIDQLTTTNPVGQVHIVIATLTDIKTAKPIAGVDVNFTIVSGPNAGGKGTDTSNSTGIATFSYNDKGVPGMDAIVASFTDSTGQVHESNKLNSIITPSSPSNSQPILRISALSSNGTILHKWTTITGADGNSTSQLLKTGFTPMNFTGDTGKTYSVNVSDFGSYAFDHWSDNGSTTRPRLVTLPSGGNNTTLDLTAIYKVVPKPTGGPATLTINALSTNSSDHSPLNMFVIVRNNGTIAQSGYTPFNFTGNTGASYEVTVANYDGKMFVKWQDDGSTSRSRMIDLTSNMTLTAAYDTGKSLRGFSSLTYTGTDEQPDLTVNALSTADNSTIRAWMIINPVSSNSTARTTTYQVYAASGYKDLAFDHWSDNGSTDRVRTLTIREAKTITAYYSKVASAPNKVEFIYKDCGLSSAGCGVGMLTNPDGTTSGPDISYAFGVTVSKPSGSPASGSWFAVIPGAAGLSGFFGTLNTLVFNGTSFKTTGDYHEAVPSGPSGDVQAIFSGQCGGTEIKFEATNGFKGTIEGTIVCTTV